MPQLRFGIVGTGMIARIIADAIDKSTNGKPIAVSSRQIEIAQRFLSNRQGVAAIQGLEDLLARPDLDAVYIGIPSVLKEQTALAAIAAGKHVLVDKPFVSHASLVRMTDAAAAKGIAFMDATHFVHHPRTMAIKAASAEKIGSPRSLNTTFYFPFSDRSNSFAFKNPDIKTGYFYRTGMVTRKDVIFISTPSNSSGEVAMIENFAEMCASGNAARWNAFAAASLKTQEYLDAIWVAVG